MKRYTFVVQVHPEGISTLENLSTQERVRLDELAAVGPQIERWLAEVPGPISAPEPDTARDPSESTRG